MNQRPPPPDPSSQPNKGPQAGPPSRPLIPSWVWWVLMLGLFVWNAYALAVPKEPPAAVLSYTAFLDQVRSGNVASVTMTSQNIDGTFVKPFTGPTATPSPNGVGSTQTAQGTATQPAPFTRFNTVAPSQPDDRLLPLLEQNGVIIIAKDTSSGSVLSDLAITGLPILLLVGVMFLMGRQAQRGQQSLFGFGGSRARVYNAERPGVSFADVAGEEEAKQELLEVVDFLKRPDRYHALGARLPRGILLIGPPGTGKTLLARAVAGEAGVPFFSISGSEFVEMFVGVGASRVRDLFSKAKAQAPAIVFVDEIDAVGRQRGAGMGGGNDEREQTLNQLLVEMDGFDEQTSLIVLAATNRPDVLDPALLRPGRFDRQVTVGLPDRRGREAILKIHTRQVRLGTDVDLEALARRTSGFSGADLANLVNEGAMCAARRDATEVYTVDFEEAIDKITLGTRRASMMSQEERRVVAYHEGGHAVVATLTPGADPVGKVSIISHGRALGITEQFSDEDRHNYPQDYLMGKLAVMLGGRASEELVIGQPSTGAESDLKQATNLARRMVGLWGMSEAVGPVSFGLGETYPFVGREIGQAREYAETTATKLDKAIRDLIEHARKSARDLLERRRELLDAVASELLAHETLDRDQLDALVASIESRQKKESMEIGETPMTHKR